jgi:hypothetical protein
MPRWFISDAAAVLLDHKLGKGGDCACVKTGLRQGFGR